MRPRTHASEPKGAPAGIGKDETMSEQNSQDDGFIIPDPSKLRDDVPGDAGDDANAIRFSEEQALIEEQSHGIRPER